MLKNAYTAGHEAAIEKLAGGPGSGVKGYNTATLTGYPRSKYVSVGTRKALLENMPYQKEMIQVADINAVSQDKYVPAKLQKFLKDPSIITKDPIDVLRAPDELACVDGHHRLLAALQLGLQELPAKVYVRRSEGDAEFEDGEDFDEEND